MRCFTIGFCIACALGCNGQVRNDDPTAGLYTDTSESAKAAPAEHAPAVRVTALTRRASPSWAWRGHEPSGEGSGPAASSGSSSNSTTGSGDASDRSSGEAGIGGIQSSTDSKSSNDQRRAGGGVVKSPSGGSMAGSGGSMAGSGGSGAGSGGATAPGCFDAERLWFEDFETGDLSRWTSQSYGSDWGDDCQSNALSSESAHSPTHAWRSEIVCPYTGSGGVHRGYGGIQLSGDSVLPAYTNTGAGVDAPFGVVTVMWMRVDSSTVFQNGKWASFWTASATCDWSDEVMTLGLEDSSGRLAAAHYQTGGGSRTFETSAPALPRGQWTRITVYINYYDGVMHVWQDGQSLEHVTFTRALKTICQFHWGLYASADNDDIVLFEDDKSLWKLGEPWTDFDQEPYLGGTTTSCN